MTAQHQQQQRQEWLRVLARAEPTELEESLGTIADAYVLRQPEVGTAMVTGRVGATGAPFALGEITVTRCVVQIGDHIGVGYVRGRAPQHAHRVAVADALLQGDRHDEVRSAVVEPLAAAHARRSEERTSDVATSRVQFVTMVRGN